jgi:hypothetical protein
MAATVANRFIAALGPVKAEIVNLTGVTDQDTFTTLIQNPKFAIASEQGADANSTVQPAITANSKTVTLHNQTASAAAGNITVIVFGF